MTDHGDSGAVTDGAKVKTGDPSPEASAKQVSPAELVHALEATDRLLQPYDQSCAELLAFPKAELNRIANVLENIREHARRILSELSEDDDDIGY
jgi:hypothetical protein